MERLLFLLPSQAAASRGPLRLFSVTGGAQPRPVRRDAGAGRFHRAVYSTACNFPRGIDVRSRELVFRDGAKAFAASPAEERKFRRHLTRVLD